MQFLDRPRNNFQTNQTVIDNASNVQWMRIRCMLCLSITRSTLLIAFTALVIRLVWPHKHTRYNRNSMNAKLCFTIWLKSTHEKPLAEKFKSPFAKMPDPSSIYSSHNFLFVGILVCYFWENLLFIFPWFPYHIRCSNLNTMKANARNFSIPKWLKIIEDEPLSTSSVDT